MIKKRLLDGSAKLAVKLNSLPRWGKGTEFAVDEMSGKTKKTPHPSAFGYHLLPQEKAFLYHRKLRNMILAVLCCLNTN